MTIEEAALRARLAIFKLYRSSKLPSGIRLMLEASLYSPYDIMHVSSGYVAFDTDLEKIGPFSTIDRLKQCIEKRKKNA